MTLGLLDRAIASVFPGWGVRRAMARHNLSQLTESLAINDQEARLRREQTLTVDEDLEHDRAGLLAIARALAKSNSWAVGAVNSITGNVIGKGMRPESAIKVETGENAGQPDTEANDVVEEVFKGWAKRADLTGKKSFFSLERQVYRERWIANDVFVRRHFLTADQMRLTGRQIPLALEVVSAEFLSDKTEGNIRQGIEFFAGVPVAYHFLLSEDSTETERVPADRVIHIFKPHRPGAVRGLSPMGPVWRSFDALKRYLNHELTRAQIASAFVFLYRTGGNLLKSLLHGGSTTADNKDVHGNQLVHLFDGGGMFIQGGPDDSLEAVNNAIQSTAFDPFVRLVLRSIATALGVSYELLARDFTKTNFSSARQSSLEDRRQWEPEQTEFVDEFLMVVWDWFVDAARIAGVAPFAAEQTEWPVSWTPQGWQWVDPVKEATALEKAIALGVDNAIDASRRQGRDFFENVRKQGEAQRFAEEHGVTLGMKSESTPDVEDKDEETQGEETDETQPRVAA